jgi:hypothetical protein
MSEEKQAPVYRAGNAIEGKFVESLLKERGIPVTTEPATGAAEVELFVALAHLDVAKEVVRAYEAQAEGPGGEAPPWSCLRCGEENEPAFDTCWNCDARPGHA